MLGDALQTQRQLSVQIVEAGGDHLWCVTANQPGLYEEVMLLFSPPVLAPGEAPVPTDFVAEETVEQVHGRLEVRRLTVSQLLADDSDRLYLAQVFRLERWVSDRLGQEQYEVRYGVTNLPSIVADAARLLVLARNAWRIEDELHYRRDVTLQEDANIYSAYPRRWCWRR